MSNFSFDHNVFKSHLLRQNVWERVKKYNKMEMFMTAQRQCQSAEIPYGHFSIITLVYAFKDIKETKLRQSMVYYLLYTMPECFAMATGLYLSRCTYLF